MLQHLKSLQSAPLSKEEPGQGAPGSRDRRTLPQRTFALAVHPSGAAYPDQPLHTKHLLRCRRIPQFRFHALRACGSSASPGCREPPGPKGWQPPLHPLQAVSLQQRNVSRELGCHQAAFPPVQGGSWDTAGMMPSAQRVSLLQLSHAACSRSSRTALFLSSQPDSFLGWLMIF